MGLIMRIEIPDAFKNRKMFSIKDKSGDLIATIHLWADTAFVNTFGDAVLEDKTAQIREWEEEANEVRNS